MPDVRTGVPTPCPVVHLQNLHHLQASGSLNEPKNLGTGGHCTSPLYTKTQVGAAPSTVVGQPSSVGGDPQVQPSTKAPGTIAGEPPSVGDGTLTSPPTRTVPPDEQKSFSGQPIPVKPPPAKKLGAPAKQNKASTKARAPAPISQSDPPPPHARPPASSRWSKTLSGRRRTSARPRR